MSEEKKLIKHLLDNYKEVGNGGRPVLNITTVMEVEFGLGLIQMDLDERYKVLKMSMWSRYKWRDEYLQWDPSEYSGVKNVRVPSERIWLPDIMLYNSADPQSEFRDVLAVVLHDGSVSWVPHQIFKSSCSLDVTNFPFDNQNCHMWFGSRTHTRAEVDVKMAFDSGIDLSTFQSDYLESSDWNIQNTTAEKKIMPPGANDTASTYAVLTFEINMKRKLVFSSYILTLPCVFLACLTLVVFWLPPDRPDRTALAMSIFSSFLVLLLILVEAAPPTASSVPVLGVYYCFNLVIIMVAVFLSALVVNVCRAGETKRKVPRWLKKLCIDWIGKVLFVPTMSQETADMASVFRNEGMQLDATPQQETRILDYTPEKLVRVAAQCNGTYRSTVEPSENTRLVEGQMKEMRKSLAHIKSNMVEKAVTEYNNSQCIKEWRDVSLVMDRVFFIVYIILIVVSLITLFPRPGR